MPAYTGTLTAAQVNALFQGFTVLAQRVSEASNAAELPATGGSVSTLVPNAMPATTVPNTAYPGGWLPAASSEALLFTRLT